MSFQNENVDIIDIFLKMRNKVELDEKDLFFIPHACPKRFTHLEKCLKNRDLHLGAKFQSWDYYDSTRVEKSDRTSSLEPGRKEPSRFQTKSIIQMLTRKKNYYVRQRSMNQI